MDDFENTASPPEEESGGSVIDVAITDEMEQSFLDYSMSVLDAFFTRCTRTLCGPTALTESVWTLWAKPWPLFTLMATLRCMTLWCA